MTDLVGEVFAFRKGGVGADHDQVAILIGLTPKVIRFYTDEEWKVGEKVKVTVERPTDELVMSG